MTPLRNILLPLATICVIVAHTATAEDVEMLLIPHRDAPDGPYRASEGSALELADGRILFVYSHFTQGGHDHEVSDIRGIVSKDKVGTQWTDPFIIQKNDARITTMIANLVRLGTKSMTALKAIQAGTGTQDYLEGTPGGAIGLVYLKVQGQFRDQMFFRLSRDEGTSWSKEVPINPVPAYKSICPNNDSVIVLTTGRIIVPVAADLGIFGGSFVYYSDDEGLTWHRSVNEVVVPLKLNGRTYATSNFGEPNIVELRDGRILMFGRTVMDRIWKSYSDDAGVTWSEAQPTDLASSSSPVSLRRIPSTGDLLLIWNQVSGEEIASGWGRMRLSCAVSQDEGETWGHYKNLESIDDITHIELSDAGETYDLLAGMHAIATRRQQAGERKPPDPKRYPRAGEGHWHVDYPSLTFIRANRAVITYGVYGGPRRFPFEQCGAKLRILPVEWFYR